MTQSCFVENVCTCVCGRPRDCKLTRLVGAVRSERIVPSPDVERRETRTGEGRGGRASLDGFAASLAKDDTVIVRVHHADHGEKAERYYVAKIATKPWQLQEGGIYIVTISTMPGGGSRVSFGTTLTLNSATEIAYTC